MNKGPEPRKALGKGLSALLPSRNPQPKVAEPSSSPEPPPSAPVSNGQPIALQIDQIEPNPAQPRSIFQPDRLLELAQSIRSNGIIQPLVVQREGTRYILVAGERRWRAARIAGLETVPAVIQNVSPDRLLEVALIENIQREDLNPIEVAQALHKLAHDYALSHEEIGQRTGKDRTTVTNLLRLLRLPNEIQQLVAENRLSMGHARAILGLPTEELQREVAEKTVAQGLSVRQVERLIQTITAKREPVGPSAAQKTSPAQDPTVLHATKELEAALGTRVRIVAQSDSRGRIEVEYFSAEELDRLYNLLIGKN